MTLSQVDVLFDYGGMVKTVPYDCSHQQNRDDKILFYFYFDAKIVYHPPLTRSPPHFSFYEKRGIKNALLLL